MFSLAEITCVFRPPSPRSLPLTSHRPNNARRVQQCCTSTQTVSFSPCFVHMRRWADGNAFPSLDTALNAAGLIGLDCPPPTVACVGSGCSATQQAVLTAPTTASYVFAVRVKFSRMHGLKRCVQLRLLASRRQRVSGVKCDAGGWFCTYRSLLCQWSFHFA